jgi:hypothetical protein
MRIPQHDEIRRVFGTLKRAVEITGGDVPTLLLYLHNPDRIAAAKAVDLQPGQFAKDLRESALLEEAIAVFDAQERPTIIETAERVGVCRQVARRLLVAAGRWPRLAIQLAPESADAST